MFKDLKVPEKKTGGGKSSFLRIKEGEEVTGVMVGDPIAVYKHWGENKAGFLGFCTGESCTFCQDGNRATYSFNQNFLTLDDSGNPTMTILDGTATLGRQLQELEGIKGDDFYTTNVVFIKRTGLTEYTITDVKAPAGLENFKTIIAESETTDLEAMLKAIIDKQQNGADSVTGTPF